MGVGRGVGRGGCWTRGSLDEGSGWTRRWDEGVGREGRLNEEGVGQGDRPYESVNSIRRCLLTRTSLAAHVRNFRNGAPPDVASAQEMYFALSKALLER